MVDYADLFGSQGAMFVGATAVAGLLITVLLSLFGAKSSRTPKPFLNKENRGERLTVELTEKENLSHDVVRFRFKLPTADTPFGLPSGRHIKVYGQ